MPIYNKIVLRIATPEVLAGIRVIGLDIRAGANFPPKTQRLLKQFGGIFPIWSPPSMSVNELLATVRTFYEAYGSAKIS